MPGKSLQQKLMEREEIVCDSFKVQKRYLENLAGKRSISELEVKADDEGGVFVSSRFSSKFNQFRQFCSFRCNFILVSGLQASFLLRPRRYLSTCFLSSFITLYHFHQPTTKIS